MRQLGRVLVAVVLAGLNERRRELAVLRAVGAAPRHVLLMLAAEGALVTLATLALVVWGFTTWQNTSQANFGFVLTLEALALALAGREAPPQIGPAEPRRLAHSSQPEV